MKTYRTPSGFDLEHGPRRERSLLPLALATLLLWGSVGVALWWIFK